MKEFLCIHLLLPIFVILENLSKILSLQNLPRPAQPEELSLSPEQLDSLGIHYTLFSVLFSVVLIYTII